MDALVSASENPVCREGAAGSEPDEGRENDGQVFHCLAAAGIEPSDCRRVYQRAGARGGRSIREAHGGGRRSILAAEGMGKKRRGMGSGKEHGQGAAEAVENERRPESGADAVRRAEPLIVNDLALPQETDRIADIMVVYKPPGESRKCKISCLMRCMRGSP